MPETHSLELQGEAEAGIPGTGHVELGPALFTVYSLRSAALMALTGAREGLRALHSKDASQHPLHYVASDKQLPHAALLRHGVQPEAA